MERSTLIFPALMLISSCWGQDQPAQQWPYRLEVFGGIAHGRLYHGDNLLGSGPEYSLGAGVRPFSGWARRFGIELQAGGLKHGRQPSSVVSQDLDSRLIMANLLYHFRDNTRTQPYVFGGLGHVKVDHTSRCVDCVFDIDPITGQLVSRGVVESRINSSKVGLAFGGGLKIAVHRHLSVRPEVLLVDTTPGSGSNFAWFRAQIGIGAHF